MDTDSKMLLEKINELEARVQALELSQVKDFYTLQESAQMLAYTVEGLMRVIRQGRLRAFKVGRRIFIKRIDIIAYIEAGLKERPVK